MSSTQNADRIQVCFQISHQKWQLLQANWSDREITESEIINALIDRYLDRSLENLLPTSPTTESDRVNYPLHEYIDERLESILEQTLEQTLEQNLDSYLSQHLPELLENTLRDEISRQVGEKMTRKLSERSHQSRSPRQTQHPSTPSKVRSIRPSSELKTAKELAVILGCSPSYITTLNRIGELVKRGWQDSGQRQGKRILYQPTEESKSG
ncbi:MAG: hypothetical protein SWY16_05380 [Cyanobacteriota bacterium]|nr:hypothetical protein [Cyanobacteriota bacterium]